MGPMCHTDWVRTAADAAPAKRSNHSADAQIAGISLRREVGSPLFVFLPKRAISTIKSPRKTSLKCLQLKKLLNSTKFCSDHSTR